MTLAPAERELGVAYAYINAGTAMSQVLPFLGVPLCALLIHGGGKYTVSGPLRGHPLRVSVLCVMGMTIDWDNQFP